MRSYSSGLTGGRSLLIAAILAGMGLCTSPAWCQRSRYQELTLPETFETQRDINRAKVNKSKILLGSIDFQRGKDLLTEYYKDFFFRALTLPEYASQLGDMRLELQKDLANAKSSEARDYVVNELAFRYGLALAGSNRFHPGARFNAMMIVGDLNQQEAVISGSNSQPPVPLEKALGQLVRHYQDEKMIDAVKVAALLGIRRHVGLRTLPNAAQPLTGPQQAGLTKLAYQLATAEEPPEGRSQKGHDWMRRLAVDILGDLGSPGPNGEVSTQLSTWVTDEDAPIDMRCAAADALGRLKFGPDAEIDSAALANKLGVLALACCQAEYDELVRIKTQSLGGMRGMGGSEVAGMAPQMRPPSRGEFGYPGDLGGNQDDEEFIVADPRTEPPRRRLISQLLRIKTALTGDAKRGIPGIQSLPEGNAAVTPIVSVIDEVLTAARDTETMLDAFGLALSEQKRAMATILGVTVKETSDELDELGDESLELPAAGVPEGATPDEPSPGSLELPEGTNAMADDELPG